MINNITKSGDILLQSSILQRKGIFSTNEAEQILTWNRKDLSLILFRLIKKGRLCRIKRGLFCIMPYGFQKESQQGYPFNWFLIAQALAGKLTYYISHYSALQLHGMTTEPIQTIFMCLPVQRQADSPAHANVVER